MIALLSAVVLVSAPCSQNPAEPLCVNLPKDEAATALQCVAADLPECIQGRYLDGQACAVDVQLLRETLEASTTRNASLQALLDKAPLPPPVPWYERPAVVAVATTAGIVGVLWATR